MPAQRNTPARRDLWIDLAGEVAAALGKATRASGGWLAVCPAHDDHDPSLSLRNADSGALLWHCFVGCAQGDVADALRRRGLLPDGRCDGDRRPAPKPKQQLLSTDRKPRWLFDQAQPIEGTVVERYLRHRRPDTILPSSDVLRCLPAKPPQFPWPAMLALVTNFADANRVVTLHFTYLRPDGSGKAPIDSPKRTLKGFATAGGIIRLTDDAHVTLRLGLAEGIEKALSIMTSFLRDHGRVESVWSALNAPNMAGLPVVPGVETLVIYGDPNKPGQDAADRLARRWLAAGRDVEVGTPPGNDWDEYHANE